VIVTRKDVTFGDIVEHLGSSSFGIMFILLAVQVIAGYQRPQLPGRLMRRRLPLA
jgi:hypothetical protein